MLAIKYIFFAAIATSVNLSSQFLTFFTIEHLTFLSIFQDISLVLGILVGTVTGLLTKYILDKKYIFKFQVNDIKHDTKTFMLYTYVGIFTTCIFWGTELLFDALIKTDSARYIGAIVGLSIGYAIKYFLDKRFVFKASAV